MQNLKQEWDQSYANKDNFTFYPHEEVIRFAAKYIRKQIGKQEFRDIHAFNAASRLLDLGCGIGRHVIYGERLGLESYGIDLSDVAIQTAIDWAASEGISRADDRIVQGDLRELPWPEGFFQFIVSHGVLDSMHFEIALAAVSEAHRVLVRGGLFYCDLVSGDDSTHAREYADEEVVTGSHEHGTIQSYFNYSKIRRLFGEGFELLDVVLIQREDVLSGKRTARYHLTARKI